MGRPHSGGETPPERTGAGCASHGEECSAWAGGRSWHANRDNPSAEAAINLEIGVSGEEEGISIDLGQADQARANVTIKGQITILQALRERFGLLPGTEVEFVVEGDALRIRPHKRGRLAATPFDAWLTKAAGSASTTLTTDQIMAITRGED